MRVLLVEPKYKNKYPPMGLMKISTYHKMLGDEVHFVKGTNPSIDAEVWDRIYVTTLFTFDFAISVETINHYMRLVDDVDSLYVGGIMASLMPDKIIEATGIERSHILTGLFTDTSVVGDHNNINVDQLPLDYDILEETDYEYPAGDNYFAYTTRGCPNHCSFCAVPILEPDFHVTNNIIEQINTIDRKYGPKQHLLLLDNNVLNTPNLEALVDDLCAAGFGRGAKYVDPGAYNVVMMRYHNGDRADFLDKKMMAYLEKFKKRIKSEEMLDTFLQIVIGAEDAENYAEYMLEHEAEMSPIIEKYRNKTAKARYLDFNQGVDGRKINDDNMTQLARLAIRPLRIAFDDIKLKDKYCAAVRTAHKHGIKEISNYILFNYKDKPEDLYERLRINIELNRELGIQIFSFPMKYSPIDRTDRDFIGTNWTKKSIRAISAILQVTKGVVAAGSDFFYKAFGSSLDEYLELLAMPRELIIQKALIEERVVQACSELLTEEKVKYIAVQVYAACKNDGDLLSVKRLKAALKEADSAIENLWVALEKGQSVDMITERIHKREAEKKELEKQLAIEIKKQSGMEYSVILSFLDYLRMLPNDNEYKRRALVNIFINAIYLYDGYFTMILNAGNRPLSIENIPLDDIEKTFENDDVGCSSNSQLVADAPPFPMESSIPWGPLLFKLPRAE